MTSTQLELEFEWRGLRLSGGLWLPDGTPPYPAVLMLQGSGSSDRDNDGYFPPLRAALVARGLAVYAFDKPGTGRSEGDWRDYGLEDRADQAIAALDMLRARPEVDAGRVGLFGHSQGGWLVQMLAGRLPDLAFAITSSGPSINLDAQNLYGYEHTMRAAGHPEEHIQQALAFLHTAHAAARRGDDFATIERDWLAAARAQPWYGYFDIADEADWRLAQRFAQEQFEPLEALADARCPFLAVFGGLDLLLPAWRSAEEVGKALNAAGNPDATVIVFPSGDHRMRDAAGNLVPGYVELLGTWVARRAGAERPA